MKKRAVLLVSLAILLGCIGCSQQKVTQTEPAEHTSDKQKQMTSVTFTATSRSTTELAPFHPENVKEMLKEIRLNEWRMYLYTKKGEEEQNIYASIETSEEHLEIVQYITYIDPLNVTVSEIECNDLHLIKIEGSIGASVPLTQYIQITNNKISSFWETESSVFEHDLDEDGAKEFILSGGGTIPDTSIIKMNKNHQFQMANLNEIFNGYVVYNFQDQLFDVYYGGNQPPERYKFTTQGLQLHGSVKTS